MTRTISGPLTFTRAIAFGMDEIVVAASPDEDDPGYPFTRIGHYSKGDWTFVDFAFAVAGMARRRDGSGGAPTIYVLGEKAEIARLDRPDEVGRVVDPNAPPDAKLGFLTSIAVVGTKLYVCGDNGQFYSGDDGGPWVLCRDFLDNPATTSSNLLDEALRSPHLLNDPAFTKRLLEERDQQVNLTLWSCDGTHEKSVYVCGGRGNIKRTILHWDGEHLTDALQEQSSPGEYTYSLTHVLAESEDKIWATGHRGALLVGNRRDGFRQDPAASTDELYYKLALYEGKLYLAGRTSLYRHDGDRLTRVRPGVILRGQFFHTIQAVDNTLWAVGPKDIAKYDGVNWRLIQWPGSDG